MVLLPLRKVVDRHSIRSADWHRIMANWAFVVDIHVRRMGVGHGGCNVGQRLG